MSLETDLCYALSKCPDKVRVFDLVKMIDPAIKRSKVKETIMVSFLPLLRQMEEKKEIILSWNSTKEYPVYVIRRVKTEFPLWMREIEEMDAVKGFRSVKTKMKKIDKTEVIKEKIIRFNKLFEEKSGDIVPSGEWQKVFMIFMENNIDNENVWVACVEAFKAGVLWSQYRDQLEGDGYKKTQE